MSNNNDELLQLITLVPTEIIPIEKIIFDSNNPNKMSDSQVKALEDVIEKYGFAVDPWVNRQDDGTYMVIDGEHRVKLLQKKGITQIQAKIFQVSYSDVRILRQVANKLRGEHDSDLDASEIKAIFDDGNLEDFAKMLAEPIEDFEKILEKKFDIHFEKEEEIPEPPAEPKCKPGEIYQIKQVYYGMLLMYEKTTNKKPNLEKKKISITLSIQQFQMLEDAAHKSKTTKSLLIGAVLDRKVNVNQIPQLM